MTEGIIGLPLLLGDWALVQELENPGRKTRRWRILSRDGAQVLGSVRWFNMWRKYVFFPNTGTAFDEQCLRDIAGHCEMASAEHKKEEL